MAAASRHQHNLEMKQSQAKHLFVHARNQMSVVHKSRSHSSTSQTLSLIPSKHYHHNNRLPPHHRQAHPVLRMRVRTHRPVVVWLREGVMGGTAARLGSTACREVQQRPSPGRHTRDTHTGNARHAHRSGTSARHAGEWRRRCTQHKRND